MGFFLFAKQIVDMLYQYRWLDYLMVLFSLILFGYQMVLVRPNIRKRFNITDLIVLLLAVLVTMTFIKSQEGYTIYFKVLSALLLYYIGRIYYDRILECTSYLVAGAYIVVYVNFIYRIVRFGLDALNIKNAGGDLYYQDTDMAFGMIIAFIFISMFARNTWYKFFTAVLVIPYMVFASDAGIQKVLLIVSFVVFLIYVWEWISESRKLCNAILVLLALGMLTIILLIYCPLISGNDSITIGSLGIFKDMLNFENMKYRFDIWGIAIREVLKSSPLSIIFGLDIGVKYEISSLYVKVFYTTGVVGLILSASLVISIIYYVFKVKDRRTYYISYLMLLVFLGAGATVNCMEAVQMSWFPFLFAGMVVSSVQVRNDVIEE